MSTVMWHDCHVNNFCGSYNLFTDISPTYVDICVSVLFVDMDTEQETQESAFVAMCYSEE